MVFVVISVFRTFQSPQYANSPYDSPSRLIISLCGITDFTAFPFILTVSLSSEQGFGLRSLSCGHSEISPLGHADGRGEEPSIYTEILLMS